MSSKFRTSDTALALAVGIVACLLLPSRASAGRFVAVTCHGPSGAVAGARGWNVAAATGQYITYSDACANDGQGALGLTMGPNPIGEYYNGEGDTMTYSVPAGLNITGYSLRLDAFGGPCTIQSGQCADGLGQVYVNHTGQSDPNYDYRNLGYGAQTTTAAASELAAVTSVNVGVSCDPGQDLSYPCPGYVDPEAQALVTSGTFALQDLTIPSVTNVSGSLIAGGTLTGTGSINFIGSDSGGGVYSATVMVDGKQVDQEVPDSNEGLCVNLTPSSPTMTFASPQPCPQVENISIPVDTSQFSEGQHHLQVVLTDAAGDHLTAWEGSITTSGPTVAGVNGGAITGAGSPPPRVANGDPCEGEHLELEVNGKRGVPVIPYGQPVTVSGVLHCGTVPISHALIAVATVGGQASDAVRTSVQSELDGSFTYQVPAGPDRELRFSYTAYSDDPEPSVIATATIAVRPRIRLTIGPHATSNGHTTRWHGTIAGRPFPRRGVTLDVEVQEGRRWMIFDQLVASSNGRFHYSYRFHATTEPTTYKFRVALPDNGSVGYPYAPGASNTVEVHVAP